MDFAKRAVLRLSAPAWLQNMFCILFFIYNIISDKQNRPWLSKIVEAMEASKSKSLASILLVDLLCLSAVGIPLLLLKYLMQPNFLGFFCSDESLRYPYSPSTIPTVVNVSVSYGIPLLLIVFINVSTLWISSSGSGIRSVMKKIYNNATIFLFGVFSVQVYFFYFRRLLLQFKREPRKNLLASISFLSFKVSKSTKKTRLNIEH